MAKLLSSNTHTQTQGTVIGQVPILLSRSIIAGSWSSATDAGRRRRRRCRPHRGRVRWRWQRRPPRRHLLLRSVLLQYYHYYYYLYYLYWRLERRSLFGTWTMQIVECFSSFWRFKRRKLKMSTG